MGSEGLETVSAFKSIATAIAIATAIFIKEETEKRNGRIKPADARRLKRGIQALLDMMPDVLEEVRLLLQEGGMPCRYFQWLLWRFGYRG